MVLLIRVYQKPFSESNAQLMNFLYKEKPNNHMKGLNILTDSYPGYNKGRQQYYNSSYGVFFQCNQF